MTRAIFIVEQTRGHISVTVLGSHCYHAMNWYNMVYDTVLKLSWYNNKLVQTKTRVLSAETAEYPNFVGQRCSGAFGRIALAGGKPLLEAIRIMDGWRRWYSSILSTSFPPSRMPAYIEFQ
jgi:hypothetical protein